MKIDIGCAKTKKQGYIGIDKLDFGQEFILDIEEGIPFDESTVEEIYTSHTLEHIDNLNFVLEEFKRILTPKGKLEIIVPHRCHVWAQSPGHVRLFDETSITKTLKGWTIETLEVKAYKCKDFGWGLELHVTAHI